MDVETNKITQHERQDIACRVTRTLTKITMVHPSNSATQPAVVNAELMMDGPIAEVALVLIRAR